jgi:hypothetical protein
MIFADISCGNIGNSPILQNANCHFTTEIVAKLKIRWSVPLKECFLSTLSHLTPTFGFFNWNTAIRRLGEKPQKELEEFRSPAILFV